MVKYKKLTPYLIGLLLLISIVSATTIEAKKLSTWDRIKEKIGIQPLYISGGDFVDDKITYGNKVNAKLELRILFDSVGTDSRGKTQKLDLEFTNGKDFINAGTHYLSMPVKQGDWIAVNVINLDTSKIPQSWCNQYITLRGKHWSWQETGWYQDTYTFGKWDKSSGGSQLICPSTPNPCQVKEVGLSCLNGDVVRQTQNGDLLTNGKCDILNTIIDRCSGKGQDCVSGQCKQKEVPISEGTMICYGSQGNYKIFTNGHWSFNSCGEGILCQANQCQENEEKLPDCTESIKSQCSDGSEITSQSCSEGILVETGEICKEKNAGTFYFPNEGATDCIEVDYTTDYDNYEDCKEILTIYPTPVIGNGTEVTQFSYKDLLDLEKYGYYTYGLIILLIVGFVVYNLTPKKRGRK